MAVLTAAKEDGKQVSAIFAFTGIELGGAGDRVWVSLTSKKERGNSPSLSQFVGEYMLIPKYMSFLIPPPSSVASTSTNNAQSL